MADSDSDSSINDIIQDWTMVNRFGKVEASLWLFYQAYFSKQVIAMF